MRWVLATCHLYEIRCRVCRFVVNCQPTYRPRKDEIPICGGPESALFPGLLLLCGPTPFDSFGNPLPALGSKIPFFFFLTGVAVRSATGIATLAGPPLFCPELVQHDHLVVHGPLATGQSHARSPPKSQNPYFLPKHSYCCFRPLAHRCSSQCQTC